VRGSNFASRFAGEPFGRWRSLPLPATLHSSSLLLGYGDGDAQLPRAIHDLTHMKDDAATSKPTIVVIDGGSAILDSIEFLLRTVGYHVTGLIVGYHVTGLIVGYHVTGLIK
jgi:hypothetical protein